MDIIDGKKGPLNPRLGHLFGAPVWGPLLGPSFIWYLVQIMEPQIVSECLRFCVAERSLIECSPLTKPREQIGHEVLESAYSYPVSRHRHRPLPPRRSQPSGRPRSRRRPWPCRTRTRAGHCHFYGSADSARGPSVLHTSTPGGWHGPRPLAGFS